METNQSSTTNNRTTNYIAGDSVTGTKVENHFHNANHQTQSINISCPFCGEEQSISLEKCMESVEKCTKCTLSLLILDLKDLATLELKHINKHMKSLTTIMRQEENTLVYTSLGMCYLKNREYKDAKKSFDDAAYLAPTKSDNLFFIAICSLDGKSPYFSSPNDIENICQRLRRAINLDQKGIYYFLFAYVICDYYERKNYCHYGDSSSEMFQDAEAKSVTDEEKNQLFNVLNSPSSMIEFLNLHGMKDDTNEKFEIPYDLINKYFHFEKIPEHKTIFRSEIPATIGAFATIILSINYAVAATGTKINFPILNIPIDEPNIRALQMKIRDKRKYQDEINDTAFYKASS